MLRRTVPRTLYGLDLPTSHIKVPGRKCLDDVCKLHLLEAATPETIINIWHTNHAQFVHYYGRVISKPAYDAIQPRLVKCPYFLVPVFRDKGLFNAVTNFNQDLVGVVPLAEYQKKGDHASPHMTVQFFTEISQSKGLVLVRCEIQDKVFTKPDCMFITQMLLKYYTLPGLYERWVETFNKRPGQYDYHAFLRHMKDEAGKDNIDIKDKKHEWKSGDQYGIKIPTPTQAAAIQSVTTTSSGT